MSLSKGMMNLYVLTRNTLNRINRKLKVLKTFLIYPLVTGPDTPITAEVDAAVITIY